MLELWALLQIIKEFGWQFSRLDIFFALVCFILGYVFLALTYHKLCSK